MKIRAEILAVETSGEQITIKLQGKNNSAAEWRPFGSYSFQVPATDANCRAYHVGRIVKLQIAP